MVTEFGYVVNKLTAARRPEDVFGPLDGPAEQQFKAARSVYRRLARVVHPDRNAGSAEAADATALINGFWTQAQAAIKAGTYGSTPLSSLAVLTVDGYELTILRRNREGDVATFYDALFPTRPVLVKLARAAADNDLLRREAAVLMRLRQPDRPEGKTYQRYLPEPLASFAYQTGSELRQANVFPEYTGYPTLAQIKELNPGGVDARDMAWVYRRALTLLGYVHARGVVHGAVLPVHLGVDPNVHELKLYDWCYAADLETDPAARIPALVPGYEAWYPAEVTAKRAPGPATDLTLLARTMIDLLGGDPVTGDLPATVPVQIRGFLLASLLPDAAQRPQDAWLLLDQFTELIERLWGPRTFRPFTLPWPAPQPA